MKASALLWLVLLPACTVAFDLSPLDEGCGPNRKSCEDGTCANLDDVTTGCAALSCQPCSATHGIASCVEGQCIVAAASDCFWPYLDCDTNHADCEANTATDPLNCGGCELSACDGVTLTHAEPACAKGLCAIGRCDSGYADCDGDTTPGCETDIASTAATCGDCNTACAVGESCVDGACTR